MSQQLIRKSSVDWWLNKKCSVIHFIHLILKQLVQHWVILPAHQWIPIAPYSIHCPLACIWSLTRWTPVWTCRWCSQPVSSSAVRKRHACPEPPHVCRTGIESGHQMSTSLPLSEGKDLRPVEKSNSSDLIIFLTFHLMLVDTEISVKMWSAMTQNAHGLLKMSQLWDVMENFHSSSWFCPTSQRW